ncbi:MAG: ComF family protein [Terriglobales bacterium]
MPALRLPGCHQCGKAFAAAGESAEGSCLSCQADPPDYTGAICAAAYRGAGRELLHLFKFRGVRPAGAWWAERLAALAPQLPEMPEVVVPVPLGRKRLRERGFNQSGIIAQRLAHRLGCDYEPLALRRRRETPPQSSLPLAERARNLTNAFAADGARVAGRRVLLVDDVLTTGATARAAARALRRAGARTVMLAVATRTDLALEVGTRGAAA